MSTAHAVSTLVPAAPLPAPNPSLFRPGFPMDDVRCLPFVCDLEGKELTKCGSQRSFWKCPDSTNYSEDCDRGTLFAAAYLLYLHNDCHRTPLLQWIVFDMADADSNGFIVGFMSHLADYLREVARGELPWRIEGRARESNARDKDILRKADAH